MGIWLNADNAEKRWKEDIMGNDISVASDIYISENDAADDVFLGFSYIK